MRLYLLTFLLNYAVELLIAAAILGKKWAIVAGAVLLLNFATHPLLWWLLPKMPGAYLVNLLLAEILVAAVEIALGILLLGKYFKRPRIFGAILTANVTTFLMTFVV